MGSFDESNRAGVATSDIVQQHGREVFISMYTLFMIEFNCWITSQIPMCRMWEGILFSIGSNLTFKYFPLNHVVNMIVLQRGREVFISIYTLFMIWRVPYEEERSYCYPWEICLYGPGDDLDKFSNAHKMVLCKCIYLIKMFEQDCSYTSFNEWNIYDSSNTCRLIKRPKWRQDMLLVHWTAKQAIPLEYSLANN